MSEPRVMRASTSCNEGNIGLVEFGVMPMHDRTWIFPMVKIVYPSVDAIGIMHKERLI